MYQIICAGCGGTLGYSFSAENPHATCPICGTSENIVEYIVRHIYLDGEDKEPTVMTDDNTEEAVDSQEDAHRIVARVIHCHDCGDTHTWIGSYDQPVLTCPSCYSHNIDVEPEIADMPDDKTNDEVNHDNDNTDDIVNHPSHYTQGDIECIDAIDSAFGHEMTAVYCAITAFTYIWRHRVKHPSPITDVQKAVWFTDSAIHFYELHEKEKSCSRS